MDSDDLLLLKLGLWYTYIPKPLHQAGDSPTLSPLTLGINAQHLRGEDFTPQVLDKRR